MLYLLDSNHGLIFFLIRFRSITNLILNLEHKIRKIDLVWMEIKLLLCSVLE